MADNLPSNLTIFQRIRNSAVNAALNNNVLRTVIARTMPTTAINLATKDINESYDKLIKTLISLSQAQFIRNFSGIDLSIQRILGFQYQGKNLNDFCNRFIEEASSINRGNLNYYILKNNFQGLTNETKLKAVDSINWNSISSDNIKELVVNNTFWAEASVEAAFKILSSIEDKSKVIELMPTFAKQMFISYESKYHQNEEYHKANEVFELVPEEVRLECIKDFLQEENHVSESKSSFISALTTISKESRISLYPDIFKDFDKITNNDDKNFNCLLLLLSIQDSDELNQVFDDIYSRMNLDEYTADDYISFIKHIEPKSLEKHHNSLIKAGIDKLGKSDVTSTKNEQYKTVLNSFNEKDRFEAILNYAKEGDLYRFEELVNNYLSDSEMSSKFINYLEENNVEIPVDRICEFQNRYLRQNYEPVLSNTFILFNKYFARMQNDEDRFTLVNNLLEPYKSQGNLNLISSLNEKEQVKYLDKIISSDIKDIKKAFKKEGMQNLLKNVLLNTVDEAYLEGAKYLIKNINYGYLTEYIDGETIKQEDIDAACDKYAYIFKKQLDSKDVTQTEYDNELIEFINLLSEKEKANYVINFFNNNDNISPENKEYLALTNYLRTHFRDIQQIIEKYDIEFMSDEKFTSSTKEGLDDDFVKYFYGLQIAKLGRDDESVSLFNSIQLDESYLDLYDKLSDDAKLEHFGKMSLTDKITKDLFDKSNDDLKKSIIDKYLFSDSIDINTSINLLKALQFKELIDNTNKNQLLPKDIIKKLIEQDNSITTKALLFDPGVDRTKIIELQENVQLRSHVDVIDINSVLTNIYNDENISVEDFNNKLDDIYRIFTYNNIPNFLKTFRLFQVGRFYDKQNASLTSIQGKTLKERDELFLGDLFRISLDSNDKSLRDFAKILDEGKRITTVLQRNPEEMISNLSEEELAILYQYRDTLFDLHNFTKEVKDTDKPILKPSNDIIKDLKSIVSVYNINSSNNRNVVFDPHKILDELMGSYASEQIRPKAILEYMDNSQKEANERRKINSEKLKNGQLHLEPGDFVKGIKRFDSYITSMLSEGIKGGEFNREFSHSDATPLDADFGYVSDKIVIDGKTDKQIIDQTESASYGNTFIVMKKYKERLDSRDSKSFNNGTLTTNTDYYGKYEDTNKPAYYVRTGIGINDIDYIVTSEWQPRFGYEMAIAGKFIPVKDQDDNLVFSQEDYDKIREQMRGLSYYEAEPFIVDDKVTKMEPLYALYRSVSTKSKEETEAEIQVIKDMISGKSDSITEEKKLSTLSLVQSYFKELGIKVTDNIGLNLAGNAVELIDTGSTGRGTNIPGDGDFDFMLRHNTSKEVLNNLQKLVFGNAKGEKAEVGDGFRAKSVTLPNGKVADIDVTYARKSLGLEYTSDMCIKDRLHSIEEKDPKKLPYVKANIIMAKKILKSLGIYKKLGSDGATIYGGFGGIGVENWILQNGGSFEQAMTSYLDAAEKVENYDEFIWQYPIFDFGNNQREGRDRHDRFSAFLGKDVDGFSKVKQSFRSNLEFMKGVRTPLQESLSPEGFDEAIEHKKTLKNPFSFTKVVQMIAKMKTMIEPVKVNRIDESSIESEVDDNGR